MYLCYNTQLISHIVLNMVESVILSTWWTILLPSKTYEPTQLIQKSISKPGGYIKINGFTSNFCLLLVIYLSIGYFWLLVFCKFIGSYLLYIFCPKTRYFYHLNTIIANKSFLCNKTLLLLIKVSYVINSIMLLFYYGNQFKWWCNIIVIFE